MSLRSRLAPFRHSDGTGCWTIGCRKDHGFKLGVPTPHKGFPAPPIVNQGYSLSEYPQAPEDYVLPEDVYPEKDRERTRKIASRFFHSEVALTTPEWKHADRLGFLSHRLDDGSEILMSSCQWWEEEFADSGYSVEMMETYWVRDGKPVAYYSFLVSADEKVIPPLVYQAEVRKEYRGERLATRYKERLNEMLTTELHSKGDYSYAGYHGISRSPLWLEVRQSYWSHPDSYDDLEGGVRVYKQLQQGEQYIHNWDLLESNSMMRY